MATRIDDLFSVVMLGLYLLGVAGIFFGAVVLIAGYSP